VRAVYTNAVAVAFHSI